MSSCTLMRRQDSAFLFSFLSTWCALEVKKFHLGAEWLFLSLCFLWGCSVCLTLLILNSDASLCTALLLCQVSRSFVESTFSFPSLSIRARTSLNPRPQFNIWTISGGLWLISFPLKIYSMFLFFICQVLWDYTLEIESGELWECFFSFPVCRLILLLGLAWLTSSDLFIAGLFWAYPRYDFYLNPHLMSGNFGTHSITLSPHLIFFFSALTLFPQSLLQSSLSFGSNDLARKSSLGLTVLESDSRSPTPSFQRQRNWIPNTCRRIPHFQGSSAEPKLEARPLSYLIFWVPNVSSIK